MAPETDQAFLPAKERPGLVEYPITLTLFDTLGPQKVGATAGIKQIHGPLLSNQLEYEAYSESINHSLV